MCGEVIAQYLFEHLLQRKLWMCTSISHDESSIIAKKKVIMSICVTSSSVNLGRRVQMSSLNFMSLSFFFCHEGKILLVGEG